MKTLKELVDIIESINPYPVDIFPEPKPEDWKEIGNFLQKHGKNPDRIFAKWGREVWQNCVASMRDFLDE